MEYSNRYNVAFMPYAPLEETLRLGQYEIWSFREEANNRIQDKDVLEQVTKYFNRYFEYKHDREKGGYDKNLDSVYIVTPIDFVLGKDVLTDEQIEAIFSLGHVLAFSSIFESSLFGAQTSDAFITRVQSFKKNNEVFVFWSTAYLKYELFKIVKPLYVENPILPLEATKLSNTLADALHLKKKNIEINRIFRALELLFHTVTFGEMITNYHRLLTLLMAFEVLLNFKNKKKFVEKIEKYTAEKRSKYEKKLVPGPGGKKNEEEYTLTGWWAFDLYDLRSQIIHGNEIDWQYKRHGDIWIRIKFAGFIFLRVIKEILKKQHLWVDDEIDEMVEAYSMDERFEEIMQEFLDSNPNLSKTSDA